MNRTLWTCKKILSWKGMDGRKQVRNLEDAILIGSRTDRGWHAPCLDFDFDVAFAERAEDNATLMPLHLTIPVLALPAGPWEEMSRFMELLGLGTLIGVTNVGDPYRDVQTRVTFAMRVPMRIYKSSTPGHHHLYIEHEIPWTEYSRWLLQLRDCGLLERGFANASVDRGMTMLLKPGLKKEDLAILGIEIEAPSNGEGASLKDQAELDKELEAYAEKMRAEEGETDGR